MRCSQCGITVDRKDVRCPKCIDTRARIAALVSVLFAAMLTALLLVYGCGCSPASQRKAIVTAAQAAELAVDRTRDICRGLAETGCTTNPCPALDKCHKAERHIANGAAALNAGLRSLNEVIE